MKSFDQGPQIVTDGDPPKVVCRTFSVARDDELGMVQGCFLLNGCGIFSGPPEMPASQPRQRLRVSSADSSQQFASLLLLLFQIQDCLLGMPGPHNRRKRVIGK